MIQIENIIRSLNLNLFVNDIWVENDILRGKKKKVNFSNNSLKLTQKLTPKTNFS